MSTTGSAIERFEEILGLHVAADAPLAPYTRFGIGGPAAILCETAGAEPFQAALSAVIDCGLPHVVIAGGTNLIVSDSGFKGVVLRFTGSQFFVDGTVLRAEAGASLQTIVDHTIELGLRGMETMTGIPGSVGGAVYGNAGAYGRSINESIVSVTFTDAKRICTVDNAECQFDYRESIFKRYKDWVVLSTDLRFECARSLELKKIADEIRTVRDAKYPPSMRCAGSIFKNCLFARLPEHVQAVIPTKVVREGKVPSAWFLEQIGAKGMRVGDIQVAAYHANLIYNDGNGTAADVVTVITDLKRRVRERFGFDIEEEVQYVGFN
jgi:UDP-N-acetylmuramate dehydrogenase